MAKCLNHNLSPSYSHKHFKCKCQVCVYWKKESAKRTNDPIRAAERSKIWRKKYPDRVKTIKKKHQQKNWENKKIPCRFCGVVILNERRNHGVTTCSDKCKNKLTKCAMKKSRQKTISLFHNYKIATGCARCKYKKFAGSLDFHHINPSEKEVRISSSYWKKHYPGDLQELGKCVLLCKNCHYEVHDIFRKDPKAYWDEMKKIKTERPIK